MTHSHSDIPIKLKRYAGTASAMGKCIGGQMKTVKVTLKLEFETQDSDEETIKEGLANLLEYKIENDELMEDAKIKVIDMDEDEDEDPDYDDEDDV